MSTNDSADLEALFDSIATAVEQPVLALSPSPCSTTQNQAEKFPSAEASLSCSDSGTASLPPDGQKIYAQLGQLTRQLHDTMRQLGFDHSLEQLAKSIPEHTDRLAYVAQMTEQAANKVLNASETAKPIQDQLAGDARKLSKDWSSLFTQSVETRYFRDLVERTRDFLNDVPNQAKRTNQQLMEIVMAQDFQDLTGQVIKKIMEAAHEVENQLVSILIANLPQEKREELSEVGVLHGPQITSEGRPDVVANQQQVDDLLANLGF